MMRKDVVMVHVAANESFTAGSMVSYYCGVNDSHFEAVSSVCTKEGRWVPDPINFTCENRQNNKGISHRKNYTIIVQLL